MERSFEKAVSDCLSQCGADIHDPSLRLGAAVSGGADSVAMLLCLHAIVADARSLCVVTVNHNLRPSGETEGDALFVQELCASLGIPCARYDIPRGKILALAKERSVGVEAAARMARYDAFGEFMRGTGVRFLCTAHTKSDHLETVLMRFLQGSGAEGLGGIPVRRGQFIRPLRNVTRAQVEAYLARKGQPFRTDSTNGDTAFLRNRIRHTVVPLLDEVYPGWQKSVCTLSQKMAQDDEALSSLADDAFASLVSVSGSGGTLCARIQAKGFARLPEALMRRVLFRTVDAMLPGSRVPYGFVRSLCDAARLSAADGAVRTCAARDIEASAGGSELVIQKRRGVVTERGFSAILEEPSSVTCGDLRVTALVRGTDIVLCEEESGETVTLPSARFPVCIRSPVTGDTVRGADGSGRSVRGVLDGWKVRADRDRIPLVQALAEDGQPVVCIWGRVRGFENWVEVGKPDEE